VGDTALILAFSQRRRNRTPSPKGEGWGEGIPKYFGTTLIAGEAEKLTKLDRILIFHRINILIISK
jgi:hypothetical protein